MPCYTMIGYAVLLTDLTSQKKKKRKRKERKKGRKMREEIHVFHK